MAGEDQIGRQHVRVLEGALGALDGRQDVAEATDVEVADQRDDGGDHRADDVAVLEHRHAALGVREDIERAEHRRDGHVDRRDDEHQSLFRAPHRDEAGQAADIVEQQIEDHGCRQRRDAQPPAEKHDEGDGEHQIDGCGLEDDEERRHHHQPNASRLYAVKRQAGQAPGRASECGVRQ